MDSKKIGSLKSTASVIDYMADTISENILKPGEALSKSPASFMNVFMDTIGSICGANFYESQMIIKETNVSTAKTKRSLMRHLTADELPSVYGSPSFTEFIIGFKESDLKAKAVTYGSNYLKKLTINKDTKFYIADKPTFVLDYNIDIIIASEQYSTADNIYAKFDIPSRNISKRLSTISNPFIQLTYDIIDGERYVSLTIPVRQYERSYHSFNINNVTNKYLFKIPYKNKLYGFEVFYKNSENGQRVLLNGAQDGVMMPEGYNFYIDDHGMLFIKFSRSPTMFSPKNGSVLEVVIYQTEGTDGNFKIENYETSLPSINIDLKQDRSDIYQDPITDLQILLSLNSGECVNGTDEMDKETLRTFIKNKGKSNLITDAQIESAGKSLGLRVMKYRFDQLIYFRMSGNIEYNDNIIPTTMGDILLTLSNLPSSPSSNTKLITPVELFKRGATDYSIVKNRRSIQEYIEDYMNISDKSEFFFPYYIQITNGSYLSAKVFDMHMDLTRKTMFDYYNNHSIEQSGISSIKITRDPITEIGNDGKYYVRFSISVSENVINILNKDIELDRSQYMKVYITFKSKNGTYISKPCSIISLGDGIINMEYVINTDSGVDNYKRIAFTNQCIEPLPRVASPVRSYFVEKSDMEISVAFKYPGDEHLPTNARDMILTKNDLDEGYYVSTVYKINDIEFYKDLTEYIDLVIDVKLSQPPIQTYQTDIPSIYTENIYDRNEDGSIKYEEIQQEVPGGSTIPIRNPIVLHYKDEVRLNNDGDVIYDHKAGDPIMINGEIQYDGEPEIIAQILNIPLVDRIYTAGHYTDVNRGFTRIIDKLSQLFNQLPDKASTHLGVNNTIGEGNYYFTDRKSNADVKIDNIALTINLGVKLDDVSGIDKMSVIKSIKDYMMKYIKSFDGTSFSFMESIEYVKQNVPNIQYIELYNINKYDVGACQSIYSGSSSIGNLMDKLCIRNKVDIITSDIDAGIVEFVPDINIKILDNV